MFARTSSLNLHMSAMAAPCATLNARAPSALARPTPVSNAAGPSRRSRLLTPRRRRDLRPVQGARRERNRASLRRPRVHPTTPAGARTRCSRAIPRTIVRERRPCIRLRSEARVRCAEQRVLDRTRRLPRRHPSAPPWLLSPRSPLSPWRRRFCPHQVAVLRCGRHGQSLSRRLKPPPPRHLRPQPLDEGLVPLRASPPISWMNTGCAVGHAHEGLDELAAALEGCDLVINRSSRAFPRNPGDDPRRTSSPSTWHRWLPSVRAVAANCPGALVNIISNPVRSPCPSRLRCSRRRAPTTPRRCSASPPSTCACAPTPSWRRRCCSIRLHV